MRRSLIMLCVLLITSSASAREFDVIGEHASMLSKAEGYFKWAGGSGGEGGEVVYVTTLADSGPGSMRSFLESTETLIIMFKGVEGTIDVLTQINVKPKKTLWGRLPNGTGARIKISPAPDIAAAFKLNNKEVNNVIFANLFSIDASGPDDDAPDAFNVRGSGGLVWVHHVSAFGDGTTNMDGFFDIQSVNVTASWNLVKDWDNVSLIFPFPDLADSVTATFHHNLFLSNRGRQPILSRSPNIFVHAFSNLIGDWGDHAMKSLDGQLLAESNLFTAGDDKDAIEIGDNGRWSGTGNVFLNGAVADPQAAGIFTPPYSYTLDPIRTSAEQQLFRDLLEAEACWQAFAEFAIPEPSTMLLLLIAVLGLVTEARKLRCLL